MFQKVLEGSRNIEKVLKSKESPKITKFAIITKFTSIFVFLIPFGVNLTLFGGQRSIMTKDLNSLGQTIPEKNTFILLNICIIIYIAS